MIGAVLLLALVASLSCWAVALGIELFALARRRRRQRRRQRIKAEFMARLPWPPADTSEADAAAEEEARLYRMGW